MDACLPSSHAAPARMIFARASSTGLADTPKEIACKYFYDEEGSASVRRHLRPAGILPDPHRNRAAAPPCRRDRATIGDDAEIVEFGAGALRKVRILLDARQISGRLHAARYFGRLSAQRGAAIGRGLSPRCRCGPWWRISPCPLDLLPLPGNPRRAGFFPGSTIGNFRPAAAMALLGRMRRASEWRRPSDRRRSGQGSARSARRL